MAELEFFVLEKMFSEVPSICVVAKVELQQR